jgi:hypothetical protein
MEMTAGSLSPEAMFRMAQSLGDDRLTAILSGQDDAVPQFVAQAVLSDRQRTRQAHAGQQAQAQMGQQQLTKKDELLAGVASIAPDDVAEMAGGGIVAFSGEDGRSDVRASRGLLPETTGYEGLGPIDFFKRVFGEGVSAAARADERMKRRLMQSALPAYNVDPLTSDLPSTANSRSPTPAEAAPAAVAPAPARGAGGGGGGGGGRAAASAPAAAAPAAPVDVDRYFRPLGNEPQLGPVTATNPYEKPKTAAEYIAQNKELLKQFGVEENPYAEREAALRAKQAAAGDERGKADAWNLVQTGAQILGTPGHWSRGVGTGIAAGAARKVASDEKFEALKDKRDEALSAIKIAQNEIKIGHVKTGIEQLNTATKNYNDAQGRVEDMSARRQEQQAQQQTQLYGVTTQADIARGQAAVQADIEMRKMAQALQISREEIAARLQSARIAAAAAAARGERTSIEMEVYREAVAGGMSKEKAYALVMGIKRPDTSPLAALNMSSPPQGAVREKGK